MSWLRSAVHKAVEVGGQNPITRTVRGYAGSVVLTAGNAVSGGAKLIQDRIVIILFLPSRKFKLVSNRRRCVWFSGIEERQEL